MVVGGKFGHREGPGWLAPLLSIDEFFGHCGIHSVGKNEKNHFCFDCHEGPLCPRCVAESHSGHSTIQVRRASHRDVVRIADIGKYVDISNLQHYTINSAKIVFLQSKPAPKFTKGALHYCETCHRSIADPVRFCSMLCKLIGIQENPHDFTLSFAVNNDKSAAPSTSDGSVASFDGGSNGTVAADFFFRPSTPKSKPSRKRKRSFFTEGGATTTDRNNNSNYYYSPLRNSEFVTSPEYAAEFSPVLSGPSTPKRMEGSVRHSGHQRKQEHPHRAPLS
ncbi:unnamed protein product [Sphagnum troendelagicum]|uniref:PLATZ transcription factor family protein n=2 Tax=Sphagnum TaxID=13804 RepID=A0ABP0V3G4_9BRYO